MALEDWPGDDPQTDGRKRLTEEQRAEIVSRKLDRQTEVEIAEAMGISNNTVARWWHRYLDDASKARSAALDRQRAEVLARLDSVAQRATRAALRALEAGDTDEARRMMELERKTLGDFATVGGYRSPTVLQLTPSVQPTQDEARRLLAEFDAEMGDVAD